MDTSTNIKAYRSQLSFWPHVAPLRPRKSSWTIAALRHFRHPIAMAPKGRQAALDVQPEGNWIAPDIQTGYCVEYYYTSLSQYNNILHINQTTGKKQLSEGLGGFKISVSTIHCLLTLLLLDCCLHNARLSCSFGEFSTVEHVDPIAIAPCTMALPGNLKTGKDYFSIKHQTKHRKIRLKYVSQGTE